MPLAGAQSSLGQDEMGVGASGLQRPMGGGPSPRPHSREGMPVPEASLPSQADEVTPLGVGGGDTSTEGPPRQGEATA